VKAVTRIAVEAALRGDGEVPPELVEVFSRRSNRIFPESSRLAG
jgi:hypothetical protein